MLTSLNQICVFLFNLFLTSKMAAVTKYKTLCERLYKNLCERLKLLSNYILGLKYDGTWYIMSCIWWLFFITGYVNKIYFGGISVKKKKALLKLLVKSTDSTLFASNHLGTSINRGGM